MSEQLKHKLLNYEVPPPLGVWKNIAQELREINPLLGLSQKMHAYEVDPPAAAWKNISSQLDNKNASSVISVTPAKANKTIVYKLLVAAVFVGVVLAGGIYLNTGNIRKQITGKLISATQKKNKRLKNLAPNVAVPESTRVPSLQMSVSSSDFVTNKRKENNPEADNKILRNAIVSVRSMLSPADVVVPAKPIRNESGDIIQDFNLINATNNKYINITGPNGEQTRISSKFLHVLLYLNGDSEINFNAFQGYFDKTFIESLIWKTRFKSWREKIIKNSFVPSSTNFLDIIEFSDLLTKEE